VLLLVLKTTLLNKKNVIFYSLLRNIPPNSVENYHKLQHASVFILVIAIFINFTYLQFRIYVEE